MGNFTCIENNIIYHFFLKLVPLQISFREAHNLNKQSDFQLTRSQQAVYDHQQKQVQYITIQTIWLKSENWINF